jgi:hypothetical protein
MPGASPPTGFETAPSLYVPHPEPRRPMASSRPSVGSILTLLAVAAATIVASLRHSDPPSPSSIGAGNEALLTAVSAHAHDRLVSVRAPVVRVLSDDREGTPHQRFLVRVGDSITVLVAHNLALADRVPVVIGDTVEVSGEYEWTPKGGTLHWTHLDPDRRHPPGYIELRGRRYQ